MLFGDSSVRVSVSLATSFETGLRIFAGAFESTLVGRRSVGRVDSVVGTNCDWLVWSCAKIESGNCQLVWRLRSIGTLRKFNFPRRVFDVVLIDAAKAFRFPRRV